MLTWNEFTRYFRLHERYCLPDNADWNSSSNYEMSRKYCFNGLILKSAATLAEAENFKANLASTTLAPSNYQFGFITYTVGEGVGRVEVGNRTVDEIDTVARDTSKTEHSDDDILDTLLNISTAWDAAEGGGTIAKTYRVRSSQSIEKALDMFVATLKQELDDRNISVYFIKTQNSKKPGGSKWTDTIEDYEHAINKHQMVGSLGTFGGLQILCRKFYGFPNSGKSSSSPSLRSAVYRLGVGFDRSDHFPESMKITVVKREVGEITFFLPLALLV